MRTNRSLAGSSALVALFDAGPVTGLGDGELLDRFLDVPGAGSEAAVAALVERHAALVWRACRSVVSNDADAADAFQATFLILLRRAGSIRQRTSVAGWLGGVARRVAANARVSAARRQAHESAAGQVCHTNQPAPDPDAGERVSIVRDELARLSARDRAVVLACDLDGLTETEAARRLDCPVGTVRSRLHRARTRLRHRFAARGLDPTAALGLLPAGAVGPVPAWLVPRTVALAARVGVGAAGWASACPVTVANLVARSGRSFLMLSLCSTSTIIVALASLAPGFLAGPTPAQTPAANRPADPPPPADPPAAAPPVGTEKRPAAMAEDFRRLKFEYDLAMLHANTEAKAGKTRSEENEIRSKFRPDEDAFARRMIDLALLDPKTEAARDAAIWVMDMTWRSDAGNYQGEYEAAVNILITHHADDPEAVRVGLQLDRITSRRRDAFLEGCYANATSHESKGLARLAYAQYLQHKISFVYAAHNFPKRSEIHFDSHDADGKLIPVSIPEANVDFAYDVGLRWIDPVALQAEVVRLYREVIADYADVRHVTRHMRRLEAELANQVRPDGTMLSATDRAMMRDVVNSKTTLADVARRHLSTIEPLAVGQPAPELAGVDLITGRPFKLADYRGRDVLVCFWSDIQNHSFIDQLKSWSAQDKGQGRPLVVLGVVSARDQETARALVAREHLPWLNTTEGDLTSKEKVGQDFKIRNVPQAVLIGADGTILNPGISVVGLPGVLGRYGRAD